MQGPRRQGQATLRQAHCRARPAERGGVAPTYGGHRPLDRRRLQGVRHHLRLHPLRHAHGHPRGSHDPPRRRRRGAPQRQHQAPAAGAIHDRSRGHPLPRDALRPGRGRVCGQGLGAVRPQGSGLGRRGGPAAPPPGGRHPLPHGGGWRDGRKRQFQPRPRNAAPQVTQHDNVRSHEGARHVDARQRLPGGPRLPHPGGARGAHHRARHRGRRPGHPGQGLEEVLGRGARQYRRRRQEVGGGGGREGRAGLQGVGAPELDPARAGPEGGRPKGTPQGHSQAQEEGGDLLVLQRINRLFCQIYEARSVSSALSAGGGFRVG
mmetsp:Transcript_34057/g.108207  ORF Transcript_34057/g.108207 Transcript_34057/m.108207 type:complete len:320 (-) Transcript_34057:33-992(-)